MAKNRSSSNNVLEGLLNLQPATKEENKIQSAEKTTGESMPIVSKEDKVSTKEELITPILEASNMVQQISKGGRPKKHERPPKRVVAYITDEEQKFLKKYGGEFDGISGYIEHLIQEEMKRVENK